jgi:hypothetical protein
MLEGGEKAQAFNETAIDNNCCLPPHNKVKPTNGVIP